MMREELLIYPFGLRYQIGGKIYINQNNQDSIPNLLKMG